MFSFLFFLLRLLSRRCWASRRTFQHCTGPSEGEDRRKHLLFFLIKYPNLLMKNDGLMRVFSRQILSEHSFLRLLSLMPFDLFMCENIEMDVSFGWLLTWGGGNSGIPKTSWLSWGFFCAAVSVCKVRFATDVTADFFFPLVWLNDSSESQRSTLTLCLQKCL